MKLILFSRVCNKLTVNGIPWAWFRWATFLWIIYIFYLDGVSLPLIFSSRMKAPLDNSSLPTFWYIRRNVFGDFVFISSSKVKLWNIYGFTLYSNGRDNTVCELIGGWKGGKLRLMFCFVELWLNIWCGGIVLGLFSSTLD